MLVWIVNGRVGWARGAVDSAGIGALVGTYVRHQRDENGVSLVGVNDRVHEALKIAHIEQFFRFFDSLGEAQAKHVVS